MASIDYYLFIVDDYWLILVLHLNTIGACWYFWKGIWASKAHEPVTLSKNATFTKV